MSDTPVSPSSVIPPISTASTAPTASPAPTAATATSAASTAVPAPSAAESAPLGTAIASLLPTDSAIEGQIAQELAVPLNSVRAVLALSAEGATVPFIARYRKERTGGLDEVQIRDVCERRAYLVDLFTRRVAIEKEIEKQGKLTDALKKKIEACTTKAELEDLYLPFKPKRRTKATIAKEKGLEPLADRIWEQPKDGNPTQAAEEFVSLEKEVPDVASALRGARDIIAERLGQDAELRKLARDMYLTEGTLVVSKNKTFEDKVTKFDTYAEFKAPLAQVLSHQYLAVRRGETEGVLSGSLALDELAYEEKVRAKTPLDEGSPFSDELKKACTEASSKQLLSSAQMDVRVELKMRADRQAVDVFATNLRQLLMAAPLGERAVLGIDPGQRTGCKVVVVDQTGKLLEHDTMYLVQGDAATKRAEEMIVALCKRHPIAAIAVGNGTHGRETEAFIKKLLKDPRLAQADGQPLPFCVAVSESGASIYSASEVARDEFPDLDLTVRGAISIARRLQDPLAELVKLDPKSIGVGQYQHDVFQTFLSKKLDEVVESCVHDVGVELNTASAPLLARVSGLGPSLAKRIVEHRNKKGSFSSRSQLLEVSGLGPRAYEQAAGFLRIRGGLHPLDASAVHPERYELVERMAKDLGVPVQQLIGQRELLSRLDRTKYQSDSVGSFTLDDIVAELLKPGRDPRDSFEPPQFRDDVTTMADLKVGMWLEGVITNVTAFGAFVDVGVHQDGLVHVSKLANRFVKDPSEVAKVGQKLKVRVVEVDQERGRISLSARTDDEQPDAAKGGAQQSASGGGGRPGQQHKRPGGGRPGGRPDGGRSGGNSNRNQTEKLTHNPFEALLRR